MKTKLYGLVAVAALTLGFAPALLAAQEKAMTKPAANSAAKMSASEDSFKQLEAEMMAASQKKDLHTLEKYLASDYVLVTVRAPGGITERAEYLKMVQDLKADSRTQEVIRVKIYGDTAVVTSKWSFAGSREGNSIIGSGYLTDVWTKQAGTWKLVLRQVTRTPPPAPAPPVK